MFAIQLLIFYTRTPDIGFPQNNNMFYECFTFLFVNSVKSASSARIQKNYFYVKHYLLECPLFLNT